MSRRMEEKLHFSFEDDLRAFGFGEKFIDELAEAALRTNYGQPKTVHSFVGELTVALGF